MKTHTSTLKLGLVALLAASLTIAEAQQQWTAGGSSQNWSDPANWSGSITPGPGEILYFEDLLYQTGYTNLPGAVNNVVSTNTTVAAINYTASSTSPAANNHFYTTLIPGGVTLTLSGLANPTAGALVAGDVPGAFSWLGSGSATNFSSITGAGALQVDDCLSLISVGWRTRASLDLSGLNTFNAIIGQIRIGASSDNPFTTGPTGWWLLAKTNTLTTTNNLSAPGILVGHATNASGLGNILLGQVNKFNTDGLVVGGRRSSTSSIFFAPNYSNTVPFATFVLRGSTGGSTGASRFSIGDDSANWNGYTNILLGTSSSASGNADFSGGTVDIIADTIVIGRNNLSPVPQTGSGIGALIVEHGNVTATNVFVGQRAATNATTATGTLTVKGDAVFNVVSNLALGYRTNTLASGTANGATATVNVNDSAILNIGGSFITGYSNSTTAPQTINIGSGQINVAGLTTNLPGSLPPSLTLAGGTIKGGVGNLLLNTLSGLGTVTNFSTTTVTNALSLGLNGTTAAGSARVAGTLEVKGSLTLSNAFAVRFKLGSSLTPGGTVSDFLKVGNNLSVAANRIDVQFLGLPAVGAYDLISFGGTQSGSFTLGYTNTTRNYTFTLDQTVPNHVKLNVAGGPPAALTWSGGANGVWDLTNNANWNNNTQKFYSYDSLLFDDTGSQQVIAYTATLLQGGITFNNNSKNYTLWDNGSGRISGFGGITKNGTGTVTFYTTSGGNDFVGPININNGVIQNQNNSSGSGQIFGSTNNVITVANGASLDLYGNTIGGSLGFGWPLVISGGGYGGIGAIAHTKLSSGPTLYTPSVTLADHASVGVATAGLNLTVRGANFGSFLNLNGKTLTTIGAGNVILNSFIATNNGDIQVNGPTLSLVDVQLGGSGTVNVGSKILGLGTLGGTGWSTPYVVSKAISIGGGIIWAAAAGGVTIPVSSTITLTGNTSISNNQSINLSGVVSGAYGLTKQGTASLIVSAADTYSGATLINGGGLVLAANGSLASSPLVRIDAAATLDVTAKAGAYTVPSGQTVQVDGAAAGNFLVPTGATIAGSGIYSGSVIANGGSVIPGVLDLPRTLSVASLSVTNAAFTYELAAATTAGAGVNDLVAAGALSFNGVSSIKIVPIGTLNTSGGQYTLFTYSGAPLPSSITNNLGLTSDTAYAFAFVDPATTPGSIQITVSGGSAQSKAWQGGVASAPTAWDINTSSNWLAGVSLVNFFNGDAVQFDDTGLTNKVTLVGNMRPAAINLINDTVPYTFQGSGSLRAGTLTNSGAAGLTIANAANNTLVGDGLFLNNGSVTFNQPTNATFTGVLNSSGAGTLVKAGTNRLTLVGNSGATFSSPVQVNNGILQAGGSNVFGAGIVTVTNSATVDVNGQQILTSTLGVSGAGVGGSGVLNNTGIQQTNAVNSIALNGDATFGASNRWDLFPNPGAFFQGNNFNLTKVGPADIFLGPRSDTSLSNIDISVGKLAFAWAGTDLGSSGSILVRSNATLSFAYDIAAGTKPTTVLPGGIIGAEYLSSPNLNVSPAYGSANSYAGDITFVSTGIVNIVNLAGLTLSGSLHGPSGLVNAGRGSLTLAGSNDYTGDLTFILGQGYIASSNALPPNTSLTINCLGLPSSDNCSVTLQNGIATDASVPVNMIGYRSPSGQITPTLGGEGAWNGPINAIAVQTDKSQDVQTTFRGGAGGLALNGVITQIGAPTLSLNINGAMPGTVAFNQPLVWKGLMTLADSYFSQLQGDASVLINTMELNAAGNSFTNFTLSRGKLRIGADNAFPKACPINAPLFGSYADFRQLIDLNGHVQTFSNLTGAFASGGGLWIGNDSTNADATLVYDSSSNLTNTWKLWINDNINTNLEAPRKTGLTVASGGLRLLYNTVNGASSTAFWASGPTNNTYTGPTLVTGGILQVETVLAGTAVTVSGSGVLAGVGPFSSDGSVTINSGGTLSPGGTTALASSIGIQTNYGSLTLNAGSQTYLEVNLTLNTNDSIRGLNNLVYNGGTLVITNVGAAAITNGTVFKLFYATNYSAGAVGLQPVRPGAGLFWNTSFLAVDGTLRVGSIPALTNKVVTNSLAGGYLLNLAWPTNNLGWRLQNQTNGLLGTITTNWFDVPGATATNQVNIPIVSTNPSVLFRLVYP
jgi:autotransporter-associated beta strand protein